MNIFRKPQENDRNLHATLYVGNIDPQATDPLLYELFIQVGPVKQMNVPKDRVSNQHQGYAFVEFKTVPDANYALDILRGVRLFGRTLKMKKADPQGTSTTSTPERNIASVGARIFISNLSKLADENYLRNVFSKFGPIIGHPTIPRDESGEPKGHGFIEFSDFDSSDAAIEQMNGQILLNNKIKIVYAYKEGSNGKRAVHGDKAERLLAELARASLQSKLSRTRR